MRWAAFVLLWIILSFAATPIVGALLAPPRHRGEEKTAGLARLSGLGGLAGSGLQWSAMSMRSLHILPYSPAIRLRACLKMQSGLGNGHQNQAPRMTR